MLRDRLWRFAGASGILLCVVGCQSAIHNTYPVPGENAGGGLRYYRSAFPRGEKSDPWEGQETATAQPPGVHDAEKEKEPESPESR
jgi:hypothetical protein